MKKIGKLASQHFRSILILVLFAILITPMSPKASPTSNVKKMLSYYKKKKYAKADAIGKKCKGTEANEKKYRKKLSKKARKAYRKILQSYSIDSSIMSLNAYLWNYFVKDLDGKGMPELCIYYGSCEADVRLRVYGFSKGKARFIDEEYCSHGAWCDYPGKKGVIYVYGHMGAQSVAVVTLKNNKLNFKSYGGHTFGSYEKNRDYDYIEFPYRFPSHVIYSKDYSSKSLSYSGV